MIHYLRNEDSFIFISCHSHLLYIMFKYQYDISSFIAYDIYRAIMYNLIKTTGTKRKTGRFYNHDRTGPATGKLAGPVPVRRSGSYSDSFILLFFTFYLFLNKKNRLFYYMHHKAIHRR